MKWIAHRGNINGPNPQLENTLPYLQSALARGYDVEIDVRITSDGALWLGHDGGGAIIPKDLLRQEGVWTHCKNARALAELARYPDINCFFQDGDSAALTSRGFVWLHSSYDGWYDSRCVLTRLNDRAPPQGPRPYAVCSDLCATQWPQEPRRPFDLLVVDIDGVLADGKLYDKAGAVMAKQYCDLDFTAIKRFQASGVAVEFMSGDASVNAAMALTRRIPFNFSEPGEDKGRALRALAAARSVDINRVAYVGDDYYDISAMRIAGMSFCPRSSPRAVRSVVTVVVPVDAGKGVIAAVYDAVESQLRQAYPVDSPGVNP